MKYNVKFLSLAIEDKKEIKAYLSKFYPEKPDYRRMLVDNYIVLYRVIEAEKNVDIIRILRASWDLPKHL